MTTLQKHYRVHEVMELLGVSRWTVYRWGKEGRIKLVKYGKRAMGVPADSLRDLMRGEVPKE
jgi:excisionase family DNA binding protein